MISADDWCNALIDLGIRPGRDVSLVAQIDGEPRKEADADTDMDTGASTASEHFEAKIRRPAHGLTLLDPIFVPGNTVIEADRS